MIVHMHVARRSSIVFAFVCAPIHLYGGIISQQASAWYTGVHAHI